MVLLGIKLISGLTSTFGCHELDYVAWFDGFESPSPSRPLRPLSRKKMNPRAPFFFSDEVAIVGGFGFPHRLLATFKVEPRKSWVVVGCHHMTGFHSPQCD